MFRKILLVTAIVCLSVGIANAEMKVMTPEEVAKMKEQIAKIKPATPINPIEEPARVEPVQPKPITIVTPTPPTTPPQESIESEKQPDMTIKFRQEE